MIQLCSRFLFHKWWDIQSQLMKRTNIVISRLGSLRTSLSWWKDKSLLFWRFLKQKNDWRDKQWKWEANKMEGAMFLRSRYVREFESKSMMKQWNQKPIDKSIDNCFREVRWLKTSDEMDLNLLDDRFWWLIWKELIIKWNEGLKWKHVLVVCKDAWWKTCEFIAAEWVSETYLMIWKWWKRWKGKGVQDFWD